MEEPSSASHQPMVSLLGVTRRFGGFTAVDNLSLDIFPGEFLTLLGPSGCGKTTLLRMISGFETPDIGQVLIDGQDVTQIPPHQRNVNQVFQSYALFPHLNVSDNIAFGLRMRGLDRQTISRKVNEAIGLVSLTGMEHRKPSQLSGGQKQRVAVARALVCEPRVLLLDEPLAALDAQLRQSMQIELKRLQHRVGITFVFVTHDQDEALTMSDRIAVMNGGKIEQLADAQTIYNRPATPFVAAFLGKANVLTARPGEESCIAILADGSKIKLNHGQTISAASQLAIRPEKCFLHRDAMAGENILQVQVQERIFKGSFSQLRLTTTGGLQLTAIVSNESASQASFATGDQVFCQLHPDDLISLK